MCLSCLTNWQALNMVAADLLPGLIRWGRWVCQMFVRELLLLQPYNKVKVRMLIYQMF